MSEGSWHEKVRTETQEIYEKEGYTVKSSHKDKKIFLYRDELKRENILSDVDLVLLKENKVVKLIEIQQSLRPKEIIGIISATNIANKCLENKDIENAELIVIIKKRPEKSKKMQQLRLIKANLKPVNGCLSNYKFVEHD